MTNFKKNKKCFTIILKSFGVRLQSNHGSTLFVALTVSSVVLVIALGILNIATKELRFAFLAKESQIALTAADSGLECALYWDMVHTGFEYSYFATSTESSAIGIGIAPNFLFCADQIYNPATFGGNSWSVDFSNNPDIATTIFTFTTWKADGDTPNIDNPCAIVTVAKQIDPVGGYMTTSIRSEGFNTCNTSNLRRVSRGVKVYYE